MGRAKVSRNVLSGLGTTHMKSTALVSVQTHPLGAIDPDPLAPTRHQLLRSARPTPVINTPPAQQRGQSWLIKRLVGVDGKDQEIDSV